MSGALIAFDTTVAGYEMKGWEVVFYVFGIIGILWFPFFYWRVYDNPDVHPHCSPEEVAIIKEGRAVKSERRCNKEEGGGGGVMLHVQVVKK